MLTAEYISKKVIPEVHLGNIEDFTISFHTRWLSNTVLLDLYSLQLFIFLISNRFGKVE